MYNRNYYAQVDDAMMKLWKDFGRRLLHVLDGTMRYVLTLPIRTYEYIYDTISGELTSQRETENRFENVKQHGHI